MYSICTYICICIILYLVWLRILILYCILVCNCITYTVWQFKNETGAIIWLIHRILQFNSYPLQCTLLPYLHTASFVSSIVQSSAIAHQPPGRSVAVPVLPSPLQLMENGVPSVHFSPWCTEISHRVLDPRIWRMLKYSNAFTGKKLLEQKGVVSWGIVLMQHPDFDLC